MFQTSILFYTKDQNICSQSNHEFSKVNMTKRAQNMNRVFMMQLALIQVANTTQTFFLPLQANFSSTKVLDNLFVQYRSKIIKNTVSPHLLVLLVCFAGTIETFLLEQNGANNRFCFLEPFSLSLEFQIVLKVYYVFSLPFFQCNFQRVFSRVQFGQNIVNILSTLAGVRHGFVFSFF